MRILACIAGVFASLPIVLLILLGFQASYSPTGWSQLLALALIAAGMITAPLRRTGRRGVTRVGAAMFLVATIGHCVATSYGDTRMVTLPGGGGSRWLGRFIDEKDGCLVGARALHFVWHLPASEQERLLPAMQDAYREMRRSEGVTASPVLDTLVGRQRPDAFDALVIEPHGRRPLAAVVFLHGYAGNFTMPCWMMAEAARAIDAVTVCPSTGFAGSWWNRDGERTLRATLDYVHARGIRSVYLAGLSNGGVGASELAPRFARSLVGLVLISGVSPRGGTGGLPTLVVQGEGDTMASPRAAHAFASRTHATYKGYDGGHFVLMVRRAEIRDAIADWLRRTRASGPGVAP